MRKNLLNGIDVKNDPCSLFLLVFFLNLFLLEKAFDLLGEFHVGLVTWAGCQDLPLQRCADQGKIADQIQQFMPCRLISVAKVDVVENAFFGNFDIGLVKQCGKALQLGRRHLAVHDDDRIADVAALDQACICQCFKLMQKAKSAAISKFSSEVFNVEQRRMLASQHRRIVVNHHRYPEIIHRQSGQIHLSIAFVVVDGLINNKKFAVGLLLMQAGAQECLNEIDARAVHDRGLGPIKIDEAIVDLQTRKRCECMLDGMHTCAIGLYRRTALGINYIVHICGHKWRSRHVNSAKNISVIFRRRIEGHRCGLPGMEPNARHGDRLLNRMLLFVHNLLLTIGDFFFQLIKALIDRIQIAKNGLRAQLLLIILGRTAAQGLAFFFDRFGDA